MTVQYFNYEICIISKDRREGILRKTFAEVHYGSYRASTCTEMSIICLKICILCGEGILFMACAEVYYGNYRARTCKENVHDLPKMIYLTKFKCRLNKYIYV